MVKVGLQISCTLEGVDTLSIASPPDFDWNLKLQCRTCHEVDDKWHAVSLSEQVEGKGGPGTFNFQMKCKFCSNVSTMDVVADSIKTLKSGENGKIDKQTLVVFDCRGVEPVGFDPQGGWTAKSEESGSTFDDVDFSEESDSWTGYDEKTGAPVSIEDFKAFFVRA